MPPYLGKSYLALTNYLNGKRILGTRRFWSGVMVVRRHPPPFFKK